MKFGEIKEKREGLARSTSLNTIMYWGTPRHSNLRYCGLWLIWLFHYFIIIIIIIIIILGLLVIFWERPRRTT